MKILVDEMPESPKDCPFCQEYGTRFETEYRCKYNPTAYYDYIHYCEDVHDCPYFRAISDTSLAEKVSDLEWSHRNYSEEE